MIFRRISEHVEVQNCTAVGLDFLIVVVGVVIGIQLGNWNDARRTSHADAVDLERLEDDLLAMRAAIEAEHAFALELQAGAFYALRALENCRIDSRVDGMKRLTPGERGSRKVPQFVYALEGARARRPAMDRIGIDARKNNSQVSSLTEEAAPGVPGGERHGEEVRRPILPKFANRAMLAP